MDHINGNRSDNRWANLRDVTHSVNLQNQRRPKSDNKCGFLGVHAHPSGFRAYIGVNKVRLDLGVYATAHKAHQVYLSAKRRLHEGCTI